MIREIEGYLLVEAARSEGRAAATRFVQQLPWLTEAQREDIERAYAEEYSALTRQLWQRTAERADELRAEYEETYRALRRRLCATACAVGAVLLAGLTVLSVTPPL
ncbi:hypothetical protein ACQB60_14515 [Actinomycetota bacterium Odt1-20B]